MITENDIQQEIREYEGQITSTYGNLRIAVRDMGIKAYQAAVNEQSSALSEAKRDRFKKTFLPLLISLFGFTMLGSTWMLPAILLVVAGVFIAYKLNRKSSIDLLETKIGHEKIVKTAQDQRKELNSIVDQHTMI